MQNNIGDKAILMRISAGLPGKNRKDRTLSESVKSEHNLGRNAGSWIKKKYPDWALEPLEKLVTEARAYHAAVTLPFDMGIGILPTALVFDYGNKMREFKGRFDNLVQSHFAARYAEMVDWAKAEHNGTFDASDYPEVVEVLPAFYFRTEPTPLPESGHFSSTVTSLLGLDAASVDSRVGGALLEGQREVMRRLIEPVQAMVAKLNEVPQPKSGAVWKEGEEKPPIFRDSLIGNIRQICEIAPKLNIGGDPVIDAFVKEVASLGNFSPVDLRKDKKLRATAAMEAEAIAKRMEAYKL